MLNYSYSITYEYFPRIRSLHLSLRVMGKSGEEVVSGEEINVVRISYDEEFEIISVELYFTLLEKTKTIFFPLPHGSNINIEKFQYTCENDDNKSNHNFFVRMKLYVGNVGFKPMLEENNYNNFNNLQFSRRKIPTAEDVKNLSCRQCNQSLISKDIVFKRSVSLPSLHWSELSALWNCHSHDEHNHVKRVENEYGEIVAQPLLFLVGDYHVLIH